VEEAAPQFDYPALLDAMMTVLLTGLAAMVEARETQLGRAAGPDDGGRRSTEGVLVVDDEDAAGFGGGSHENDRPRISPGCRWCRHHCCPGT
jgi:hypothetical protein